MRCNSKELFTTMPWGHIVTAATCADVATQAGEMEKDDCHEQNVITTGGKFFPVTVETLGCWTPSSLKTLKTIASKTTSFTEAFRNLIQQLSVKLWSFNARMIHSCLRLHAGILLVCVL